MRRRHHLQLVLHILDPLDTLGHFGGGRFGLGGVNLPAEHHHAILGLDVHLPTLHAVIGEERDLGLGGDPRVAHSLLCVLGRALDLVSGLVGLLLDLFLHGRLVGARLRVGWPGGEYQCRYAETGYHKIASHRSRPP